MESFHVFPKSCIRFNLFHQFHHSNSTKSFSATASINSIVFIPSISSYLLISSIPFVKSLIRDWHKCQPLIYFSLRPRVSDLVDSGRQGKGYFTCRLFWVNWSHTNVTFLLFLNLFFAGFLAGWHFPSPAENFIEACHQNFRQILHLTPISTQIRA